MAQSIRIKRKGLAALLAPKATIKQSSGKKEPKVKAYVRRDKA
jgi:hypothetical protein